MRAAALMLADARTPTGSYAHSGGLEAAIADGLTVADVPAFLHGRLRTVAFAEAALTAAATRAAGAADLIALLAADDEALARTPSPRLRAASTAVGRGLLRTAAELWPAATLTATYRVASEATPRPVALGVAATAGGLDPREAALVALHDDAATLASAAVKLLPVDAAAALAWVSAAAPELEALADAAAVPRDLSDLPSGAAPLIDLRALRDDPWRLFAT